MHNSLSGLENFKECVVFVHRFSVNTNLFHIYHMLGTMSKSKRLLHAFLITFTIICLYALIQLWEKLMKGELRARLTVNEGSTTKTSLDDRSSWVTEFREHEFKGYSQNGEDGVLLWVFANIGTINHPPYFVEFGVEGGHQCNTRFLRRHLGWQGLMMDGDYQDSAINLHKEFVTADNINDLLAKYQTPSIIDLLSIDVE